MRPSSQIAAAPTGNFEYGEYDLGSTSMACWVRFSQSIFIH
jgi:hypothetical protein